jgi:hypothetical protein
VRIIPCLEVTVVDVGHTLKLKHASSVYTVLHKRNKLQRVVSIYVHQIPSVEDDRLESGVRSLSSGVLRGFSIGTIPVLVWYLVRFSMALLPYLQLWHLRGLVFIVSVSDLHSCVSHFLPHGDATPIVATHHLLDDVGQDNVARIPVQQCQVDYCMSQY